MRFALIIKKNKFKTTVILVFVSYILLCPSCATMRMKPKEVKVFFDNAKISFKDTTVVIEKSELHYLETGNKDNPTLFFVHGSPGSAAESYKEYLRDSLLLKKYRMIAIDRPGFGYSNFGKAKNLYEQAHSLEAFIDKTRNGKNIYLIGHSYGGPIIVKMAIDQPTHFKEIVILAGAVDPDAENPEKWRPIFIAFPLRYIVPGALRPSNDELWWLKTDLKNMKSQLKNITTNVLIIHGTKDPLVPYSNTEFMQREFTSAKSVELMSIKDANHFIPWEHFSEIRDKLLNLKE